VAAQQLWWQRSDGGERWGAAMGRSDGREGGGAAMAMAAQRLLQPRSDGNGDGDAAMGVAVVVVAADVCCPPLCVWLLICCSRRCPPLFATDVRDVFCIFLLSLHIFNVGTPYTQTDTDRWTTV
jgi:hypothetical protein